MRDLAIRLLDDDEGITVEAWNLLKLMLDAVKDADIINAVKCTEGRCYLSEGFGT
jgi:hypothetical protein